MFEISLVDVTAGAKFIFPVNPEEVKISRGKGYETISIMSFGEFDISTGEKVSEITFSSFFPLESDSYCNPNGMKNPKEAMERLTEIMNNKNPVRLIVEDLVNLLVVISVHDSTIKGGEPGDIYFELTARTWRRPKVHTKVTASSNDQKKTSRTDLKNTPKTYTVKSGDSLSKIAKLELGDSSKWQAIYNLNKAVIGPNSNLIKPGQKLVLPS